MKESVFYAAWIWILINFGQFQLFEATAQKAIKVVTAFLSGVLIMVQLTKAGYSLTERGMYPLAAWHMYSSLYYDSHVISYFEYRMLLENGEELVFDPDRLFPTFGQVAGNISYRLVYFSYIYPPQSPGIRLAGPIENLLGSFGRKFRELHPNVPIKELRVYRRRYDHRRREVGYSGSEDVVFRQVI